MRHVGGMVLQIPCLMLQRHFQTCREVASDAMPISLCQSRLVQLLFDVCLPLFPL